MEIPTGYLKIALAALTEVDFNIGRPIKLEDLDRLSSENMLKIMHYFLTDIIMGEKSQPASKIQPLNDFNDFGIGDVTYDCTLNQTYNKIKQIFPENDELFSYSVLLLPAQEPNRTKKVISYVVLFHLLCDNMHEQFKEAYDQVIEENIEKVEICSKIEDLREKIVNGIQKYQEANERVPVLEREVNFLETGIRERQSILAKLVNNVQKHKDIYEKEGNKISNMQRQLEHLYKEKKRLESMVVSNPKEIKDENAFLKAEMETKEKERKVIGGDLDKLRKQCDGYESLISRAKDTISNFNTIIVQMRNARANIESFTKNGNEVSSLSRKTHQLSNMSAQLTHRLDGKRQDADRILQLHEVNMNKVVEEVEKLEMITQDIHAQTGNIVATIHDVEGRMKKIVEEYQIAEDQITERLEYIEDIEKEYARRVEMHEEKLQQVVHELCTFPKGSFE